MEQRRKKRFFPLEWCDRTRFLLCLSNRHSNPVFRELLTPRPIGVLINLIEIMERLKMHASLPIPEVGGLESVKKLNDELHGGMNANLAGYDLILDCLSKVTHGYPDSRILQTLVLRSPVSLNLRAASIILLNDNSQAINFASHGYPSAASKLLDIYTTMEERLPSVESMLTGRCVVLRTRNEIDEYGIFLSTWASYIPWLSSLMAFPLLQDDVLIGSVVWGFDHETPDGMAQEKLFTALSYAIQLMFATNYDRGRAFKELSGSTLSGMQAKKSNFLKTDYKMSDRQAAIAEMLASGASNREIATSLFISESMARYETIKIYERLRVKNRAQAAVMIRSTTSER